MSIVGKRTKKPAARARKPGAVARPPASAAKAPLRRIVIVLGLSGAGRNTALHALEDFGYVQVDNLPLALFDHLLTERATDASTAGFPIAVGLQVGTTGFSASGLLVKLHEMRRGAGIDVRLVYLDCDIDVLLRRFTETRRAHPLARDGAIRDGLVDERRLLAPLRDAADLTIDTSALAPHELKALLAGQLGLSDGGGLRVAVMSFSYRRGLPRESDLVFDARFLRNPHYVPALRPKDGRDADVRRYVAGDKDFKAFFEGVSSLLDRLLPRFQREGKSYLTVAVGCTGGRHRSVMVAEMLAKRLRKGHVVALRHRDVDAGAPSGRGTESN